AAALTGANLGTVASPFSGTVGGPPKTGQFFMAIDPQATSDGSFADRISSLVGSIHAQDGARLPGDGRGAKRRNAHAKGVAVSIQTLEKIQAI
ncbi:MAG: Ldh family oxidoreductase, partial [Pseudomonadota bacterium]